MIDSDGNEVEITQLIGVDQEYELFISVHNEKVISIDACQYSIGMMYRVKYKDGQVILVNPAHIIEVVVNL